MGVALILILVSVAVLVVSKNNEKKKNIQKMEKEESIAKRNESIETKTSESLVIVSESASVVIEEKEVIFDGCFYGNNEVNNRRVNLADIERVNTDSSYRRKFVKRTLIFLAILLVEFCCIMGFKSNYHKAAGGANSAWSSYNNYKNNSSDNYETSMGYYNDYNVNPYSSSSISARKSYNDNVDRMYQKSVDANRRKSDAETYLAFSVFITVISFLVFVPITISGLKGAQYVLLSFFVNDITGQQKFSLEIEDENVIEKVRTKIGSKNNQEQPKKPEANTTTSSTDLIKLAELMEKGLISREEFEQMKSRILS
ncbi:MAG: SHOCT domain-containing protein [Lachnospiraceae bacterium]|nr:SHOCT domain-containing protein [Lachnospiraceae bacterium]